MTRKILQFPDERLYTKAATVNEFDAKTEQVITDLFDTLHAAGGGGLAATQIDEHLQIFVISLTTEEEKVLDLCFVNPEFIYQSSETFVAKEACMSFKKVYANVERACEVTVKALDKNGQLFELSSKQFDETVLDTGGWMTKCLQHEYDHLQGVTFDQRLSKLKRSMLVRKFKKEQKLKIETS